MSVVVSAKHPYTTIMLIFLDNILDPFFLLFNTKQSNKFNKFKIHFTGSVEFIMEFSSKWHLRGLNAIQSLFSSWISSPREYQRHL